MRPLILLLALAASLGGAPALAHPADMATLELLTDSDTPDVRLRMVVPTAAMAAFDDDHDGALQVEEVTKHREALSTHLAGRVTVYGDGRAGRGALVEAQPGPPGTTAVTMTVALDRRPTAYGLRYTLFPPDQPAAHVLARVPDGPGRYAQVTLTAARPAHGPVTPTATAPGHEVSTASAEAPHAPATGFGGFVSLGVEHILTGYDHLLFLLALLLGGTGLGYMAKVITGFTVGHSITLAAGALGVLSLPSRWVEAAIALSIVIMSIESIVRPASRWRWVAAAGFGLVHGLGFASILREMAMPPGQAVWSLLGFNLGVELGQLGVAAIAVGALGLVAKAAWAPRFRQVAAVAVALVGLFWFVERVWPAPADSAASPSISLSRE